MSGRNEQTILRLNKKTSSNRSEYNSPDEVGAVYAGWLTKSPEDRKGLFSLFATRQQWRRRYFVLYTAATTSEVSAWTNRSSVLIYYDDEMMTTKKGMIDLGSCEEVIDHVESCYYRHLFLLKTATQRGQRRTCYLAADSADDVTSWVSKLRSTLNLYEDKLFTDTVLSFTNSGSNVAGIITRIANFVASSDSSKTDAKKKPISATLMSDNPNTVAVSPISHLRTQVVNSECTTKGFDLLSSNAELYDTNSGTSVSKRGMIHTCPEITVLPSTAAQTGFPTALNSISSITRSLGSKPSPATSSQSRDRQNEAPSSNACNGQVGAEDCIEWQKFVKEVLYDEQSQSDCTVEADEHKGSEEEAEEEEVHERKVEGRSVFYSHKGKRPNLYESNDEAPIFPSAKPSSDVQCYLRITKGSHRYRSIKKKHRTAQRDAVL